MGKEEGRKGRGRDLFCFQKHDDLIEVLLKCIDLQCCVNLGCAASDSVTCIYIYFFIFLSVTVYRRILTIVPSVTQKVLLLICSIYNNLSANPKLSVLPSLTSLPVVNHKSALHISESVSLPYICSFVSYFIFHIEVHHLSFSF